MVLLRVCVCGWQTEGARVLRLALWPDWQGWKRPLSHGFQISPKAQAGDKRVGGGSRRWREWYERKRKWPKIRWKRRLNEARLNESKLATTGGWRCFSGTARLIILSQQGDWITQFHHGMQLQLSCNCCLLCLVESEFCLASVHLKGSSAMLRRLKWWWKA